MLKTIFELLTSQLGLPIHTMGEYMLITVIGYIAYRIAWNVSPGGPAGSLIHWSVRLIVFAAFWGCAYVLITFAKWVIQNWIIALTVVVSILLIVFTIVFIRNHSKQKERM